MRSQEELARIYERRVEMVYRICFMFLKNATDTEDAVSTTFSKLMTYKKEFDSLEHEKAWLIVTASNTCKNMLRHWWRRTISLTPKDETMVVDQYDELLEQVLSLPAKYKAAIYLYYYEGYSSVEIATMLNKKESTIRTHLKQGRELLKLSLGGDDE